MEQPNKVHGKAGGERGNVGADRPHLFEPRGVAGPGGAQVLHPPPDRKVRLGRRGVLLGRGQ